MKPPLLFLLAVWVPRVVFAADPGGEDGFRSLFDGRSLAGWETPDRSYWTVEDGAITGRITQEHPCTVNQYLVWQEGELADFELKLKSRLNGEGGINNGFQFRSRLLPDHDICGYQVDNNLQTPWLVRLYDEFGRHTLAWRGERTVFGVDGARATTKLTEAEGDAWFRLEDWHEYHLQCVGPKITLRVDGRLAAEVEDCDRRRQELQGVLGLQLHSGPPTVVQFKEIRLKVLKPAVPAVRLAWEQDAKRLKLRRDAWGWWPLDSGAHGVMPALRHVPGWEKFELNVAAEGPQARPGARVILMDGAYFDGGNSQPPAGRELTVYLRARDPRGTWNAALFGKREGADRSHFNLFGADLSGTAGPDIAFEVTTDAGRASVSFPVSRVEPTAWHDLVGRYDGATLEIYCDGRRMAGRRWSGALRANGGLLLLGAEAEGNGFVRHFHGELEEAALWLRALTKSEISRLTLRP